MRRISAREASFVDGKNIYQQQLKGPIDACVCDKILKRPQAADVTVSKVFPVQRENAKMHRNLHDNVMKKIASSLLTSTSKELSVVGEFDKILVGEFQQTKGLTVKSAF